MKMKNAAILIALFVFTFILSSVSYADIPIIVDRVEIDDIRITPDQTNRLSLERGRSYQVEIELRSEEDLKDVEIEISVSGFEHSDVERQSVVIPIFDVDEGNRYVKRGTISFSDDIDEDDYRLRILISDRDHAGKLLEYRIKLDVPRHRMQIEDVSFFPGSQVEAGSALLTTVRLENKGEKDEDDVKVTVSVPELGLMGTDFIEEIEYDDEEETEEIFLTIPRNTVAGVYLVQVEVEFNEGRDKFVQGYSIEVLENSYAQPSSETRVEVVVQAIPDVPEATQGPSLFRTGLEIVLLVLVGLLVVIGIIVGFTKLRREDEF